MILAFQRKRPNQILLDGNHLSSNHLINNCILLFNQHGSNSVEEETMMYSSTSNLKICLYKLTTCVRIPLDLAFLLYIVYRAQESFNINLPTAHFITNHVDRDTKVEGCDAHACCKQNKTIFYCDKAVHTQSRIFNYAFLSTLYAIIGHFATFEV